MLRSAYLTLIDPAAMMEPLMFGVDSMVMFSAE